MYTVISTTGDRNSDHRRQSRNSTTELQFISHTSDAKLTRIHCWRDLIRSKQLSSVSVCRAKVLAGFSGHGNSIHNIISQLKIEECRSQQWMFSIPPPISNSFIPLSKPLGTVSSVPITNGIIITLMLHIIFLVLWQVQSIRLFFRFLWFSLCDPPRWQSPLYDRFTFLVNHYYLII